MKKILPILTVIGCSALFVGCDSMLSNSKTRDYSNNLRDFKESINKYNQTKPENIVKTVGNYNLSIVDSENDVTSLQENIIDNNQSEGLDTTDIKEEDLINETPIEETPVEIDEEFSYIENSPNEEQSIATTYKEFKDGDYYITLVSSSGVILESYKVTIKEPLNFWAIVVIIVIVGVVVAVVTTIVVLRRKMRIR